MTTQTALVLSAIVISWVMFLLNFVLGYYIGRAVESGEKIARKKKVQAEKTSKQGDPFLFPSPNTGVNF